jgi:perosamine synthetase
VSSCTTALHVAVILAGLKPGDEALVPSYTFVATANALMYAGVRPIFVEIDPKTYNVDPSKLEAALTPKTKAVMLVNQFGLPADLDAVQAFCDKHKIAMIEDAACALGGRYKDRKVGAKGKFITLSFHPRKSITTGEGGAVVTDDAGVAEQANLLRSHGASMSAHQRHDSKKVSFESYVRLGYNYRISDVLAAIGLAQLKKLDFIIKRRREVAARYAELLKKIGWIDPPFEPPYATHPFQTYAALLRPNAPVSRDQMLQHLANMGISAKRGIPPIHHEPYMKGMGFPLPNLPVTDDISARTLILPLYPAMTEAEQDQVVAALQKAETAPQL